LRQHRQDNRVRKTSSEANAGRKQNDFCGGGEGSQPRCPFRPKGPGDCVQPSTIGDRRTRDQDGPGRNAENHESAWDPKVEEKNRWSNDPRTQTVEERHEDGAGAIPKGHDVSSIDSQFRKTDLPIERENDRNQFPKISPNHVVQEPQYWCDQGLPPCVGNFFLDSSKGTAANRRLSKDPKMRVGAN